MNQLSTMAKTHNNIIKQDNPKSSVQPLNSAPYSILLLDCSFSLRSQLLGHRIGPLRRVGLCQVGPWADLFLKLVGLFGGHWAHAGHELNVLEGHGGEAGPGRHADRDRRHALRLVLLDVGLVLLRVQLTRLVWVVVVPVRRRHVWRDLHPGLLC